ncbi:hypothetical protein [Lewinella sp. IMCC34191]|uniref:hypothetical protein n=1 Tax=Lewinella sp. IMCC34191 TaxID=2259172 RepID=UPI000E27686A|nr:hypothetical protein [Lewinella sp. IMCC34191]
MHTQEEFAEQRRRNQTAYAIEDFNDAVDDLRHSATGNLLLAFVAFIGSYAAADNLMHVGFAFATGIILFLLPRYMGLQQKTSLYLLLAGYVAGIFLEYVAAGLPSPPFPELTVGNGWVGVLPFANSLFPLLYIIIRIGLLYPLVDLFQKRQKLAAQPMHILRQLDRDLAAKLE